MDKHSEALEKSNWTNRQKALDNPNNKRAVAILRTLAIQDLTLQEMADVLNTEGFTAPQGGKFKPSQIDVLLKRYKLRL